MSSQEEIIIGTQNTGLGDALLLTSVCRHAQNKKITINLKPACKKFAFLFQEIADKIIFTENPVETIGVGGGHFARRKCRLVGYDDKDYLPYIKFNNKEYDEEINEILSKFKNPIILKTGCSKQWKHVRQFPIKYWQDYFTNKSYNFIQFELSDNFLPYPGAIHFLDAPLEKQAAYYKAVKRYIGVDTGDLHLMLALGGHVEAHVPPNIHEYKHNEWHYESGPIKYIVV
jgi:hypothetical protein